MFKGIKNLLYWLPVIWKDRDYDYGFLLKIMHHKMKAMEKCIGADCSLHNANLLLEDLIANNYDDHVLALNWEISEDENGHLKIDHNNTEEEVAEFSRQMEEAEATRCKDKDKLFENMAKGIFEWWD